MDWYGPFRKDPQTLEKNGKISLMQYQYLWQRWGSRVATHIKLCHLVMKCDWLQLKCVCRPCGNFQFQLLQHGIEVPADNVPETL